MAQQLIQIADNSRKHLSDCSYGQLTDEQLKQLQEIEGVPIKNINLEENPRLLVFPQCLTECKDKIQDSPIFSLDGDNFLSTNNIMGFIGYKDTRLRIHSRFVKKKQDFFLHYMLQKVLAINLFNLKYTSDQIDIFDFLIYLFPTFLKQAYKQGLYKEYQTRNYNDSNIRGRIDISRHISQNIPFVGRVAYQTREYTYDNSLSQLIRHTIEYIRNHQYAGDILRNDSDTSDAVRAIVQATTTYNRQERQRVINQNLRPLQHPYFREYRPLQQLCLQILRHDELKYGTDNNEIYGILFDGAWLWEEYLNTFLNKIGFKHPRNKEKMGRIYLFENNKGDRYPDFYQRDYVLDAKYKQFETREVHKVDRNDLHQLIAYMFIEKATKGGFVFPAANDFKVIPPSRLMGYEGSISLFGLIIPQNTDDWYEFQVEMKKNEDTLMNTIIPHYAQLQH